jgi:glycosyltransferase involved in cell wall biosynthesis
MRFSLVIPVAPERGAEILESIKKLDYPKSEFQVIVVNGKNPSENRNKGALRAVGEIIGFLDDDATLQEDFLKNVDKFFQAYDSIDVVGGPQLTPLDEKGFARISGYALCSKFGAWELASRYSKQKLDLNADEKNLTSANLFVKRAVMSKIKFDPNLFPGEDPKFIEDARKAKFKVAYSPDFILYHRRRATWRQLIKQIFNYGKVRPAKEPFRNTLKQPFFLVPSIFSIYLFILLGWVIFNPSITGGVVNSSGSLGFFGLFLIPLLLYVILALSFAGIDSWQSKDLKGFFVLPFVYPMIHVSYGVGMIKGYLTKFSRSFG